jgi:hypothetical protein
VPRQKTRKRQIVNHVATTTTLLQSSKGRIVSKSDELSGQEQRLPAMGWFGRQPKKRDINPSGEVEDDANRLHAPNPCSGTHSAGLESISPTMNTGNAASAVYQRLHQDTHTAVHHSDGSHDVACARHGIPAAPQQPLGIDDPLGFLTYFDTCFLIDDSKSMRPYWDEVTALVRTVIPLCTERDTSGVDIYFSNHKPAGSLFGGIGRAGYRNIGLVAGMPEMHDNVEGIFNHVQPHGSKRINKRLNQILGRYMGAYKQSVQQTRSSWAMKPLNIIVVTAQSLDRHTPEIVTAVARQLDQLDAPSHQLGIQLFRIGDDPAVAEQMELLDDGIEHDESTRDIVDTTTWTGGPGKLSPEGVLKVVGGAVQRSIDGVQLDELKMPNMPRTSW